MHIRMERFQRLQIKELVLRCYIKSTRTLRHLSIRSKVVRVVTFYQVDTAPHAEASAQSNNKGLQDFDCAIEKFHGDLLLTIKSLWPVGYTPEIVDFDKLPTAAKADLPVYPEAWGK